MFRRNWVCGERLVQGPSDGEPGARQSWSGRPRAGGTLKGNKRRSTARPRPLPLPFPHLHPLQHVPSVTTVLTRISTHTNTPAPRKSVRLESHDQIPQLPRLPDLLRSCLSDFLFSFINPPPTPDQEQVETDFLLTAGDPAGTFVCVVVGTNQRTTGQVGGASHRNSARPPTAA